MDDKEKQLIALKEFANCMAIVLIGLPIGLLILIVLAIFNY